MTRRRSLEVRAAATADADVLAVLVLTVPDAARLVAARAHDHDVADVDRRLLRHDAARLSTTLVRRDPRVLLDAVHALDEDTLRLGHGQDDLAGGTRVLARDDADGVALLDRKPHDLQHLRGERDDFHELAVAQLPADRAEDARAARVTGLPDEHCGVLVEPDVRTVRPAAFLGGPNDDGADDVTLLDACTGQRVLDRADDDVADAGIASARAAEHTDAQDLLGARVVGDPQSRFLLDHRAFSRISTTRQRFVADRGRVSISRTRSPTPHVPASSCALSLLVRRIVLP